MAEFFGGIGESRLMGALIRLVSCQRVFRQEEDQPEKLTLCQNSLLSRLGSRWQMIVPSHRDSISSLFCGTWNSSKTAHHAVTPRGAMAPKVYLSELVHDAISSVAKVRPI